MNEDSILHNQVLASFIRLRRRGWWLYRYKRFYSRRRRFARSRALYWGILRSYDGEICQRCGRPVFIVYWAPSDLWERYAGFARDTGAGILCPTCFSEFVGKPLYWTCSLDESIMPWAGSAT